MISGISGRPAGFRCDSGEKRSWSRNSRSYRRHSFSVFTTNTIIMKSIYFSVYVIIFQTHQNWLWIHSACPSSSPRATKKLSKSISVTARKQHSIALQLNVSYFQMALCQLAVSLKHLMMPVCTDQRLTSCDATGHHCRCCVCFSSVLLLLDLVRTTSTVKVTGQSLHFPPSNAHHCPAKSRHQSIEPQKQRITSQLNPKANKHETAYMHAGQNINSF